MNEIEVEALLIIRYNNGNILNERSIRWKVVRFLIKKSVFEILDTENRELFGFNNYLSIE